MRSQLAVSNASYKSIGQLLSLLHILDCDVALLVKTRKSA